MSQFNPPLPFILTRLTLAVWLVVPAPTTAKPMHSSLLRFASRIVWLRLAAISDHSAPSKILAGPLPTHPATHRPCHCGPWSS